MKTYLVWDSDGVTVHLESKRVRHPGAYGYETLCGQEFETRADPKLAILNCRECKEGVRKWWASQK